MFERFTERARQVIVLAQEEARGFKHDYIGTEHLLLALIREEDGLAARVLEKFNVDLDTTRNHISTMVGVGRDPVTAQQIPFTPRAKKILEIALREGLSLGHSYVGTEHILLGLVRENEGVAYRILTTKYDLRSDQIRGEVLAMLSGPSAVTRNQQKEREKQERIKREQERAKLWTPKAEEEISNEDGPSRLEVNSVRGQVITISGDLTLEVDRDIYGRLNILIKNPSGLPLTISEK